MILISKNFCHQSILYDREMLNKNDYQFNVAFKVMADWLLNLKIYSKYKKSIVFSDRIIVSYRLNGYSGMNNDRLWAISHYFLKIKYLQYNQSFFLSYSDFNLTNVPSSSEIKSSSKTLDPFSI